MEGLALRILMQGHVADEAWVEKVRGRLADLGWFMKCLKEPLARLANREDDCRGAFWEGRYKSIAVLDEASLLATCAYIDLNPLAAGVVKLPEEAEHTSLHARLEHVKDQGCESELQVGLESTLAGQLASSNVEETHWLCPIQDRRTLDGHRAGLLPDFPLSSYLKLLDWASRLVRRGKARLTSEVSHILHRLGTTAPLFHTLLTRLFRRPPPYGTTLSLSAT